MTDKPKSNRGFASLSLERRRELASMGGKAVPAASRSFSLDQTLAKKAGSKGGSSVPGNKRSFAQFPKLAQAAGRKGGLAARAKKGTV